MALMEREVGVAVAATAAALSPKVRGWARQGAVYGLAGAMKTGDVLFATARGAAHGAREGISGNHHETRPASASRAASSSSRPSAASRSQRKTGSARAQRSRRSSGAAAKQSTSG
jgi:hypothetical protein